MKRSFMAAVAVFLVLMCIGLGMTSALAVSPEIHVITDDGPNSPRGHELAVRTYNPSLELWHHSGGYWSIGDDIKIFDHELKNNLLDEEALSDKVESFEFKLSLDQELKDLLASRKQVQLFVSSAKPDVSLDKQFDPDTISVKVEGNTLIFEGKPKFHFFKNVQFNDIIGERLQVELPIVDPDYGENRYSIWSRESPVSWGAASAYFDKDDPFAPAPAGSKKIAPSQIINKKGHLADGFTFETVDGEGNRTMRNSGEAAVGSGTLDGGGAVSIRFVYPLKLTFYTELAEDLSVSFSPHVSSAAAGNQVTVGAMVSSSYDNDLAAVPYRWTITDSRGRPVEPVIYDGYADAKEGQTTISAEKKVQYYYASFTMPDAPVTVAFDVNPEGTSPEEAYLDNNRAETVIKPAAVMDDTSEFELDYHILSRDVEFSLANSSITAHLSLPGLSNNRWNGPASGQLNVTNETPEVLRNFQVHNNPAVHEEKEVIQRDPVITATLRRVDFGDDPVAGVYHPGPSAERTGRISFGGHVTRPYVYTVARCEFVTVTDPETGEEHQTLACHDEERYGTAQADFNQGVKTVNARAKIYNGMPEIPPQVFANRIDSNTRSDLKKKLWWSSEPYDIRVIRWMYHMDADGNPIHPRAVDGQYVRTFVQQNSGVLEWKVATSMASLYGPNREAARERRHGKTDYDYAVFSSDRDVRDVDYPIKSGYYFNPAGEYTFTIETVTYKPTNADTKDHKDLVEAVIRAFRYESDLIYINRHKEAVNLQNEPVPKEGNSYGRKAASLTADDPTGVDNLVLLRVLDRSTSESRYEKQVEELPHAQDAGGYTHPYWKQIMEGHEESGTRNSYTAYKYAEYVKSGQRMYRITERTTVTIQINVANAPVYTHAHMPDGTYTVRAWMEDVDLSKMGPEYRKLGVLRGIRDLDRIEVTVKGSLYDDIE